MAEDAVDVVTGSFAVLLAVSAAEGCEAMFTYRQCLRVGFAVFHPVTLPSSSYLLIPLSLSSRTETCPS